MSFLHVHDCFLFMILVYCHIHPKSIKLIHKIMTDFGLLCTKSHNQSNASRKNPLIRIAINSIIRGFTVILLLLIPYILCFSAAKNAFVSFTITPLNANNAIIFGIAISPLKISAIVHTALTVMYGPINTARM